MPNPPRGFRPFAHAEVHEVFSHADAFQIADVVAEVVADREKRILRVQRVVVPRDGTLAGDLPARVARRERSGQERIDAERAYEPEVGVDADDLVVVSGRVRRLAGQKNRTHVAVPQHVAPRTQHGEVVARPWPIVDSVWTVISPTPMPPARPVSRPPAAIGSGSPAGSGRCAG